MPKTSALPHVHRVTKYDPADRDGHGRYTGTEDTDSDRGPVEAAYLAAVAAFAEDSGVTHLEIREPALFGAGRPFEDRGLAGLFPPDLTGYHDGALVPVAAGLELVRAMLRGDGASCRLEVGGRFSVDVGYDQYVYVGSAEPCERAVARTRELGLFPERLDRSPHEPQPGDRGGARPADDAFWDELTDLATRRGAVLLEEGYLANASRWHRVRPGDAEAVRAGLAPRAWLLVWPDLDDDVAALLDALPARDDSFEVVWEDRDGRITALAVDDEDLPALPARLAGARAAAVVSWYADRRHPLLAAVLPDADGVLRARWVPE
ncbi:RNA-binding protein [Saccharothrix sp. Mg75]|uniref:RNA-binding protein n=1 Tax=Saccharothrix sp. Mg75 TaxID=3445357 RepID=UPI003EEF9EA0